MTGKIFKTLLKDFRKKTADETEFLKNLNSALVGAAQWIECWPMNQRVAGSILNQGTCLGCGPGPLLRALERQPHLYVSLPLFLPLFPSLKINKIFKKF